MNSCLSPRSHTHVTSRCGFATYVLRSGEAEVRVVPALGAKITSLRDLRSGREWLWSAPDGRELRENSAGDAFEAGSMAGIDECVPTIAPSRLGDQMLPDHGEAWARAWTVNKSLLKEGRLHTSLDLECLPLRIERELTLEAAVLTLRYRLINLSSVAQPGFWALHPLFARREGDRIELPCDVADVKVDSQLGLDLPAGAAVAWPSPNAGVNFSTLTNTAGAAWCAKLFVTNPNCNRAAIANDITGDRLDIDFESERRLHLGIWITRGGWNGFDHFALEPTTHAADTPCDADAATDDLLLPHATRSWSIRFSLTASETRSGRLLNKSARTDVGWSSR